MTITAISVERAVITILILSLAIAVYAWKIRPVLSRRDELIGFYAAADGFWGRVYVWVKTRWDIVVAAIAAATPIVWNGFLDAAVGVSLFLGDALPAISGLDLSALILPPWAKTTIQIGGALAPIIRTAVLRKSEG